MKVNNGFMILSRKKPTACRITAFGYVIIKKMASSASSNAPTRRFLNNKILVKPDRRWSVLNSTHKNDVVPVQGIAFS